MPGTLSYSAICNYKNASQAKDRMVKKATDALATAKKI